MASIPLAPGRVSMPARVTPRLPMPRQRVQAPARAPIAPTPATLPLPLWEATSAQGRRVRLTRESHPDAEAVPYYVVAYGVRSGPKGGVLAVRYTPSAERALALLAWFLLDVTDAERLRPSGSPSRPNGVTARPTLLLGSH